MKILKSKLLKLCLVCLLVVSMIPSYSVLADDAVDTWDGTVDTGWINEDEKEFHLYTAEELAGLAEISNSSENNKKNILEGKNIYFEKDFDLKEGEWKGIVGNTGAIIDGKEHNILNLNPDALFKNITNNTTVKNINIINADIEAEKNALQTGVLARFVQNSIIENCYVSGKLKSGEDTGRLVGSTAGQCTGSSKVIGCGSDAEITSKYDGTLYNDDTIGGIVGQWEDATKESLISDCWFGGTIFTECPGAAISGILGANFDFDENDPGVTIKNCITATKDITSITPDNITWIGAVVNSKIENCIWSNEPKGGLESNGGKNYLGIVKLKLDEGGFTASMDPDFDQSKCGIEVSNFNDEAVLTSLQNNATSGIKWIKGIKHPTFEWNAYNIPADYTELDKLLAEVYKLNKNDYVDFSEVESALATITKDKNKLQQDEVNKMYEDLKVAVDKLEKKPSSGGGGSVITPSEPTKEEIIGKDRYETAALVADKVGNYDTVVLVNADETMADGLSASSLSGKYNAPILLVKQNKIPDVSMNRIQKAKKVYIIGGTNAIGKEIEKQLSGKNITRIGGANRYETSELIAKELGNYSKVFIVNGKNGEADAMSASSVAAKYKAPIILTNGKSSNYIKEEYKEYYVIGGKNVVSDSIVEKYSARRIAGDDRYETNRKVISEFYSGSSKYYVANGNTLVDALTASILAQEKGVVLVNEKSDNSILKDKSIVQIGGFDFEI